MEAVHDFIEQFSTGEHLAVNNLFEQPQNREEWEKYILPDWQLAFFEQNGFISGIELMDEAVADHLNQLLTAKRVAFLFADILILSPAYRMAAFQLLGKSFRLFQESISSLVASERQVIPWQQDFSYCRSALPMRHLMCQVALQDVDELNGCTYYVPGSHKFGLLPISAATGSMDGVKAVLTKAQLRRFEDNCPSVLKKGCASFHHPLTLHGAYPCFNENAGTMISIDATDEQNSVLMPAPSAAVTRFGSRFKPVPAAELTGDGIDNKSWGRQFPLSFDGDRELDDLGIGIPKVNLKKMYGLEGLRPSELA